MSIQDIACGKILKQCKQQIEYIRENNLTISIHKSEVLALFSILNNVFSDVDIIITDHNHEVIINQINLFKTTVNDYILTISNVEEKRNEIDQLANDFPGLKGVKYSVVFKDSVFKERSILYDNFSDSNIPEIKISNILNKIKTLLLEKNITNIISTLTGNMASLNNHGINTQEQSDLLNSLSASMWFNDQGNLDLNTVYSDVNLLPDNIIKIQNVIDAYDEMDISYFNTANNTYNQLIQYGFII